MTVDTIRLSIFSVSIYECEVQLAIEIKLAMNANYFILWVLG